jgi:hypothetical protein
MKKFILGLFAAGAIAITPVIPAEAADGSGNATIVDVSTSCASPTGVYTVTWVAYVTDLSRHNTPTEWSINGVVASVYSPIVIVRSYTRQAVLFSSPPRIAVQAYIGFSRPMLTDESYVPGYCSIS